MTLKIHAKKASSTIITYESKPDKKGFRTIFVLSSSKRQEDERRRQKRIAKALSELKALSPKLNAYHLKTKKEIQAVVEASKTDGIFPLVTNTDLKASDVLRKYKSQPFLEKRMYTKKTVLEVAPVFLKKEKRIEAMLFLYFAALMVVSLIELKIRMNMKKEAIEKLSILPQGMNTKKPTWKA